MKKTTFYIPLLCWIFFGIMPIYSMENEKKELLALTYKQINIDKQRHELAMKLQPHLCASERLNHVNWVELFEEKLRNACEEGGIEKYEQYFRLKMKTAYSLPASFPDGYLFSPTQVGQALKILGVFDLDPTELGIFWRFVGVSLETLDPWLLETDNILNAYIAHGNDMLHYWEYKIEEVIRDLISLPFDILLQKDNQTMPALRQDFDEENSDNSFVFIKSATESSNFHVEPIIDIISNRGLSVLTLSDQLSSLGFTNIFDSLSRGLKNGKAKSFSLGGRSLNVEICNKLLIDSKYDFRREASEIIDTLLALEFTYQLHKIILTDNFEAPFSVEKELSTIEGEEADDPFRTQRRLLYPRCINASSSKPSEENEDSETKIALLTRKLDELQQLNVEIMENIAIELEKQKEDESNRIRSLEEERKTEREIASLREELKNLQRLNDEILENNAKEDIKKKKDKSNKIEALKKEKVNAEREIASLREELKSLQRLNDEILKDFDRESERNMEKELDRIRALNEELDRIRALNEELDRIRALDEEKRKAAREIEDLREELKNLEFNAKNKEETIAPQDEKYKRVQAAQIERFEEDKNSFELQIQPKEDEEKKKEKLRKREEKLKIKGESNRLKELEEHKLKINSLEIKIKKMKDEKNKKEEMIIVEHENNKKESLINIKMLEEEKRHLNSRINQLESKIVFLANRVSRKEGVIAQHESVAYLNPWAATIERSPTIMDPIKTIKTPTSIVLIDKSGKSVEIIPTTTGE